MEYETKMLEQKQFGEQVGKKIGRKQGAETEATNIFSELIRGKIADGESVEDIVQDLLKLHSSMSEQDIRKLINNLTK